MSGKNNFVFVVCGDEVHIKTLNYSLEYLRKFSKNKIVVVTDIDRNEVEINHNNIINVKTPESFNHHQASIYLKTGLYKYLDLSDNYCYLDSDVIALSPKVDEIFNYSYGPITFAADHCKMNYFSPSAVNCGCSERNEKKQKSFMETLAKIIPDYNHDILANEKGRELRRVISTISQNPLRNVRPSVIISFVKKVLNLRNAGVKWGKKFIYSKSKNGWIDLEGNVIMHNITAFSKEIETSSNFSYSKKRKSWIDENGESVFSSSCEHLSEKIMRKFNIQITRNDFQHWNGGVFLFNKKSVDFLETWLNLTMEIFKDEEWKTRDQGTLIATVWKFNLQHQKLLPKEFNFIADYDDPEITYRDDIGFTTDNFKSVFYPNFIHIYHHYGNENWDVWRGVKKIFEKE